jgi:hypothetical protein
MFRHAPPGRNGVDWYSIILDHVFVLHGFIVAFNFHIGVSVFYGRLGPDQLGQSFRLIPPGPSSCDLGGGLRYSPSRSR